MAYDKHEWVTDEIITAELLNNIEDGIEAVDEAVDGINIPTQLPPTDNSVTNAKVSASAAIALSKLANVAAGTDGLSAGTIQETFQAVSTRIQSVDDEVAGITVPTELPPTDGSVTNAKVATGAAIALNKLANVAAGDDGLAAGTIQATLQALATRIQALEDATGE